MHVKLHLLHHTLQRQGLSIHIPAQYSYTPTCHFAYVKQVRDINMISFQVQLSQFCLTSLKLTIVLCSHVSLRELPRIINNNKKKTNLLFLLFSARIVSSRDHVWDYPNVVLTKELTGNFQKDIFIPGISDIFLSIVLESGVL